MAFLSSHYREHFTKCNDSSFDVVAEILVRITAIALYLGTRQVSVSKVAFALAQSIGVIEE